MNRLTQIRKEQDRAKEAEELLDALLYRVHSNEVGAEELDRIPEALMELASNPLKKAIALARAHWQELHTRPDLTRIDGVARGSEDAEAVRSCITGILDGVNFPDADELLARIDRHRKENLEDLIPQSAASLLRDTTPLPQPIIEGLLYPGTVLVIGGAVKTRKTWLAIQMALSLASGEPFLVHPVTGSHPALYVGGEGSEGFIQDRLKVALQYFSGAGKESLERIGIACTSGRVKLDTEIGERWLRRASRDYEVIIIDPYYRFLSQGSENLHEDQRVIQNCLDRLKASGKTIVLCHHTRKPTQSGDSGAAELRGAGLDAFADSIVIIRRSGKDRADRYTLNYTLRHDEQPEALQLCPHGPLLVPADPAERLVTGADVVRVLKDAGGRIERQTAFVAALRKKIDGCSDRTCQRAINNAEEKGLILVDRIGRGSRCVYTLPPISGNGDSEHLKSIA